MQRCPSIVVRDGHVTRGEGHAAQGRDVTAVRGEEEADDVTALVVEVSSTRVQPCRLDAVMLLTMTILC